MYLERQAPRQEWGKEARVQRVLQTMSTNTEKEGRQGEKRSWGCNTLRKGESMLVPGALKSRRSTGKGLSPSAVRLSEERLLAGSLTGRNQKLNVAIVPTQGMCREAAAGPSMYRPQHLAAWNPPGKLAN